MQGLLLKNVTIFYGLWLLTHIIHANQTFQPCSDVDLVAV